MLFTNSGKNGYYPKPQKPHQARLYTNRMRKGNTYALGNDNVVVFRRELLKCMGGITVQMRNMQYIFS
jgi:hypothetical protein